MHVSTTGRLMFTADEETLDKIADYCDKKQLGDVFLDDESDDLILTLEEDWSHGGKARVMNFVSQFHKKFPTAQIYMIGTITDEESDRVKSYECQGKADYVRYRETEWLYDAMFDEDMSCEEFEEENYVDVDEDEYEEYVHRAKKGIRDDENESYGNWEYLDE